MQADPPEATDAVPCRWDRVEDGRPPPWAQDDDEFRRSPDVKDHGDARKRKSFLSEMFEFGE